jgi:hypothetical protein
MEMYTPFDVVEVHAGCVREDRVSASSVICVLRAAGDVESVARNGLNRFGE